MKKLNNSSFEMIGTIIKELDFDYNESTQIQLTYIQNIWGSLINKNFSKISKVYDILKDGTLIVICSDSFVANELYLKKNMLINELNWESKELGIKIKDIKFDYKRWEKKSDE